MKTESRQSLIETGYIPVDIDKQNEALVFLGVSDSFRVQIMGLLEDVPGTELLIHPRYKLVATYRHGME